MENYKNVTASFEILFIKFECPDQFQQNFMLILIAGSLNGIELVRLRKTENIIGIN